jgi:hypothetical protein
VTGGASNPTFADAGWADDEQILVPCDPLAGNEFRPWSEAKAQLRKAGTLVWAKLEEID